MKIQIIKTITCCVLLSMININARLSESGNCDSLNTEYKNKIREWKSIFKEITTDKITETQYDSLLSIYKQKWNIAHEAQILFMNCRHPQVKITVENFENPPLVPEFKNKEKFSVSKALNQLCDSFIASSLSYTNAFKDLERRLESYDYFTDIGYDSLRQGAAYYLGEALKYSKYYSEVSSDTLYDFNLQAGIKPLPGPPFFIDENYSNIKSYFKNNIELNEESVIKMKTFLIENYPPEAITEGVSGKVRFCFVFDNNNEPADIKILYEKPRFYGFSEAVQEAVKLLKCKAADQDKTVIHKEMTGIINFKLNVKKQDNKISVEIDIRPFYSG